MTGYKLIIMQSFQRRLYWSLHTVLTW